MLFLDLREILGRKDITEHLLLKKYIDHLTSLHHQWMEMALISVRHRWSDGTITTAGTELRDHFIDWPHIPAHKALLGSENPLQPASADQGSGALSVRHEKRSLKSCLPHLYKESFDSSNFEYFKLQMLLHRCFYPQCNLQSVMF